jgi:putative oxidoreductase
VAEEKQMNQTPNLQPCSAKPATQGEEERPTPKAFASGQLNPEVSADSTTSNIKHQRSNILWRIVDLVVAGIFIYAGALKVLDPVQFAHDIKNFQILPWPVSVALAFYQPWLEIFCGVGLVFRFFYHGALCILSALIAIFTLAIIAAKVRGLDITCGCFGHASQHWSFPAHLATNLGILAALVVLWFSNRSQKRL